MPGAFGLQAQPQALWDKRLLFDAAGNILMQGQFADSAVARPGQTRYIYDGLDQLAQAAQDDRPIAKTQLAANSKADAVPSTMWRYHHDSLGNRLLAQQQQPSNETAHTSRAVYESGSNRPLKQGMDANGRPITDSERHYVWNAEGQLAEVNVEVKADVKL